MSRPLRVLLVEDAEDDALLVLRALRTGGYEPESQRVDTPEAMRAALDSEPWDIVISDYSMPKFSGPAALALLQAGGRDLPFIVVSGAIGEEMAVGMMRAGAHDYVMKGRLARLVPAVERELREAEDRRQRRRAEQEREKLIAELQQALAEIKTLSRLLPICAWCKKVRNDHGYWDDVTSYFTKRENIRWTHGICPECSKAILAEPPATSGADAAPARPKET